MTKAGSISNTETPRIVVIGGLDSSGGAGLVADVEAISEQGAVPCCVATALALQTDDQYISTDVLETSRIHKQLEAALSGQTAGAVKTGMLANGGIVDMIVGALKRNTPMLPLVVDPVFKSSSGGTLLDEAGIDALRTRLISIATIVTPNISEAEYLSGITITSEEDMSAAAHRILGMGCEWVLVKGGHLEGSVAFDVLVSATDEQRLDYPMLPNRNVRGTGCRLASAIAARLALGEPVQNAVCGAKAYVFELIEAAGREA